MSVRRRLLFPLVPLYGAALTFKKRILASDRFEPRRLPAVVISIGSVSAGGAGKTPVVLLIAKLLERRGYPVSILSRGYGRRSAKAERVDPMGDTERYGDEPILLAQRSGLPVYVGADRYKAGLLAQDTAAGHPAVYLLDDGFQHRRLGRDLDIVLLTRKDVDDVLLPAGNLREPLTALRDADVIVLREDEVEALDDFVSLMTRDTGRPPVWVIRRTLRFSSTGASAMPARPVVFCGIARPESFTSMLNAEGLAAVATAAFADHHVYTERDITRLLRTAQSRRADGFVTTEKDAVKLSPKMRRRLERVGSLVVPVLQVDLLDEKGALEQMISMVERLDRRKSR